MKTLRDEEGKNIKSVSHIFRLAFYSALYRLQESLGIHRGKIYFQYLYSKKNDIWNYKTSRYELEKYHKIIEMFEDRKFHNSLEIGCSIGVFTNMLAEISDHVTALDFASIAVGSAKIECKDKQNIEFVVSDIFQFVTNKKYDLICAAEVLYYMEDKQDVRDFLAKKICNLLEPGGLLLYVCGDWDIDRLNDWENYFQQNCGDIELIKMNKVEDKDNNYRISILQKKSL